MSDHFAQLSAFLGSTTDYPVYVDIPHKFELGRLPAIGLYYVGPAERRPALNSLGIDMEDIDVDIFIPKKTWVTGEAFKLAQLLRMQLYQFRTDDSRCLEVTRPTRRPDRNPTIRRLGMTVTVASPASPHF